VNLNLTLIGQAISFAIFVLFCMKYVWPPLIGALRERQASIADGLAAAERSAQAKEEAQAEADELLKDARNQAAEIVAQAQKRHDQIVGDAQAAATAKSDQIMAAKQAEIEQEVVTARESLRQQVSSVAVAGAEKILKREVDASAHAGILDDLIAKI
jgi:F-type H+-transporting ATPase subunit b